MPIVMRRRLARANARTAGMVGGAAKREQRPVADAVPRRPVMSLITETLPHIVGGLVVTACSPWFPAWLSVTSIVATVLDL
ncbi:hypothetical protein ABZ876_37450 [Streptomyces sp. NPDC046931]|uniref:hypothetical protein n=1 Tax=Streptomyces sp. NPDC046931 TaxID=3154806 RepID=UPI0033F94EF5